MTFQRIAVGIDFSTESQCALDHAVALARHTGTPLTLIHVAAVPDAYVDVPRSMKPTADAWRQVLTDRLDVDRTRLGELREGLSGQGVEVSHVVVDGFADTRIAATAAELGANLVIVGSHGRTGLKRLLLGSVAEKTVRIAEGSVLVARGAAVPGGYRRVVVGVDFSPRTSVVLERTVEVLAAGAYVRIVHAWAPPYGLADLDGGVLGLLREEAEASVAGLRAQLAAMPRPADVTVDFQIVEAAPVAALDDLSGDADLVVVGSHGWRGVRRFLVGSVAEATVRHARCTVLVAR